VVAVRAPQTSAGASTSPPPFRNGDFVDGDPAYLAKTFSTIDQVLLADWVAGGMQADRDTLVRRLREGDGGAGDVPAGGDGAAAVGGAVKGRADGALPERRFVAPGCSPLAPCQLASQAAEPRA
jgi:hypothetical protein